MSEHEPTEEGFPEHLVGVLGVTMGILAGGAAGRMIGMAIDGGRGGGGYADAGFFIGIGLGGLLGYGFCMLLQIMFRTVMVGSHDPQRLEE